MSSRQEAVLPFGSGLCVVWEPSSHMILVHWTGVPLVSQLILWLSGTGMSLFSYFCDSVDLCVHPSPAATVHVHMSK